MKPAAQMRGGVCKMSNLLPAPDSRVPSLRLSRQGRTSSAATIDIHGAYFLRVSGVARRRRVCITRVESPLYAVIYPDICATVKHRLNKKKSHAMRVVINVQRLSYGRDDACQALRPVVACLPAICKHCMRPVADVNVIDSYKF